MKRKLAHGSRAQARVHRTAARAPRRASRKAERSRMADRERSASFTRSAHITGHPQQSLRWRIGRLLVQLGSTRYAGKIHPHKHTHDHVQPHTTQLALYSRALARSRFASADVRYARERAADAHIWLRAAPSRMEYPLHHHSSEEVGFVDEARQPAATKSADAFVSKLQEGRQRCGD